MRATAINVFYARGFEGASVQAIADELGILKGSLYHYISSKSELLFDLLRSVHVDLQLMLEELDQVSSLPPTDRLYWYVRKQVEYATEHLREVAIYYRDFEHLAPEHRALLVDERDMHEQYVAELIESAQEQDPAVARDSARALTNLIFGSFIWTYRWYEPGNQSSQTEFADTCARFAVRAIGGTLSEEPRLE